MTQLPTPDPEVAQVYKEDRSGELYQIIYVDAQIVLLRGERARRDGENIHRLEMRSQFNEQVKSNRLELQPDSDIDLLSLTGKAWSEVDYIGEKTAENLHDEGFSTIVDVRQAKDEELLSVDGLGKSGLKNLRSFAQ
jgi:ERCC4-type nuclease